MWHLKKKASSELKFFTIIGKMENLEIDWGRDGLYITFEVKGIRFFDYPDQWFADNGDIVEVTYCYLSPESPSITHISILAKYSNYMRVKQTLAIIWDFILIVFLIVTFPIWFYGISKLSILLYIALGFCILQRACKKIKILYEIEKNRG